jgi:hypothetical protein
MVEDKFSFVVSARISLDVSVMTVALIKGTDLTVLSGVSTRVMQHSRDLTRCSRDTDLT